MRSIFRVTSSKSTLLLFYFLSWISSSAIVAVVDAFSTLSSSATLRIPGFPTTSDCVSTSKARSFYKQETTTSTTGNTTNRKSLFTLKMVDVNTAWDAYNHALELHPLIVKSITASIILGLGDFAGQAVQNLQTSDNGRSGTSTGGSNSGSNKGLDYSRAARFAIFGLVLQAPWNHYYYLLLDGLIPPTVDEPFSMTNMMKVGIDQFIQAPIFTVLIFVFLGVLEGKAIDDIKKQLQNDYPETIVANWKLWIPATVVNIAFVPPLFRVLYLNCVFFFWSIYLSLVLNREEVAIEEAENDVLT